MTAGERTSLAGEPNPLEGSARKPTVAVVPFDALGEVPVRDAGKILAERLLPLLGDEYELVDLSQLKAFLAQADLSLSGLVEVASGREEPGVFSEPVRLRAVRYLVVGTVAGFPDGKLVLTARLSQWQTGVIGSLAKIEASDWSGLDKRLPLLAASLTGRSVRTRSEASLTVSPLASSAEGLAARVIHLEGVEAELDRALGTMSEKHPQVVYLRREFQDLARGLQADIGVKIEHLKVADAELAGQYRPSDPRRQEIAQEMNVLVRALSEGVFARAFGPPHRMVLQIQEGVSVTLVLIPAGEFTMGSPLSEAGRSADETEHRVIISKPFYMSSTEITQRQYKALMGGSPSKFKAEDLPVDSVSWDTAVAFCENLSERTGKKVRLPTESEWEYACRGGTRTPFITGATISTNEANYDGNYVYGAGSKGIYHESTVLAGSYAPNAYGLHDMLGNVWEWCRDWYSEYPRAKVIDPQGPVKGEDKVLRGGSWSDHPSSCRSANRHKASPSRKNNAIGFRVVIGLE
ncbi:MAG TPA: formylglycine-generating enzyme family protein [Phycisphaerae bacterium]|nr:formylglycine-generating enzyme family protein [Phycisphaerae bacterium]